MRVSLRDAMARVDGEMQCESNQADEKETARVNFQGDHGRCAGMPC